MDEQLSLSLCISPCPNDTYIFGALAQGLSPAEGMRFNVLLEDVETLNAMALMASGAGEDAEGPGAGGIPAVRPDVIKVSAAVAGSILSEYALLDCGGALGRGCGPLLVGQSGATLEDVRHGLVASPGRHTTANLLLDRSGLHQGPRRYVRYDEVMPMVAAGRAAAGVVIHEGRFTYAAHGLTLLRDLGQWWEETTGLPIPLGVIAVRRSLGPDVARRVAQAIRSSLAFAADGPQALWPYIAAHAQEMDEAVIHRHIETFVTDFSHCLGDQGQEAVLRLLGMEGRGREVFA